MCYFTLNGKSDIENLLFLSKNNIVLRSITVASKVRVTQAYVCSICAHVCSILLYFCSKSFMLGQFKLLFARITIFWDTCVKKRCNLINCSA